MSHLGIAISDTLWQYDLDNQSFNLSLPHYQDDEGDNFTLTVSGATLAENWISGNFELNIHTVTLKLSEINTDLSS